MNYAEAIIVGAGPCGLSAAIELKNIGIEPLIIEKHNLVNSIYRYPTNLQFFSTPELLEIGNVPFTTPNEKPYRHEALVYYLKVAERYQLKINAYEEAIAITKQSDCTFLVTTRKTSGETVIYSSPYVIDATGYFDHPNMLGIPGEDLPHVSHYFQEAHPYAGMDVVIIGCNNSAVDASLELLRVGARVTIVHRGPVISEHIKPWVRPIFDSMVAKGLITIHLSSQITTIEPDYVTIAAAEGQYIERLPCRFVLALTGFRPDRRMLEQTGVQLQEDREKPVFDPATMQTNIKGLYIAGVIASGRNANEIFIETGRGHGKLIAQHIQAQRTL
ncbi:YpdA family putative bacillithiol disulfide reductase [Paenibacillus sp. UMB4589-SE434]|uniref:YpdA family putative bacillithiol disulfide reductase n=1 Tax=Paenibacillus sp. UMB4589-SE434 TaxID=3046314 RepID=UPI002551481F|nr:YpdA family putative bacillithiol disulfide reductase [Paenibacillus sp. UMB4589-SE434]MDK8182283.1 YpdA family putative bacillithiol disulfide reductase [Paenibacillus sp. UMB4589-SE434]